MKMPGFTAQSSLYKTTTPYRTIGNLEQGDGVICPAQLTTKEKACVDRCMDACIKAGIEASPPDVPIAILRDECYPICLTRCEFLPPPCPPDTKLCGRTGKRPECCPTSHKCCHVLNEIGTGYTLSCCPPGQECCFPFGCYAPEEYQCTRDGLCPKDRVVCQERCCGPGEVCTQDGCAPPEQTCNGRRCAPGDQCTIEGCCPQNKTVSNNHCCDKDWSWSTQYGKCCRPGECCEFAPCPDGKYCCGNKRCCPSGWDCKVPQGKNTLECFKPRR